LVCESRTQSAEPRTQNPEQKYPIMINVFGIKIIDRIKEAGLTQNILSNHASLITTRLGFHEVTDEVCSREAYIILHLNGDPSLIETFRSDLLALEGTELREMNFTAEEEPLNEQLSDRSVEILGILAERDNEVIRNVQKLLTAYGCNIRTRLGLNEVFFGEPAGLIILELKGDREQRHLLEKNLKELDKVHVRSMVF
jgi:hypothetical protein